MKVQVARDEPAILRPALRAADADTRAPLEEIRALTGHSGAKVTLCRRGSASIVRKAAARPTANARLIRQAEKQRALSAHGIAFPAVTVQGTDDDGIAYFEMAYVPSLTLASTIATAASYDRAAVVTAVDKMLWLFRGAASGEIAATAFEGKINDVASACAQHAPTLPHLAAIHRLRDTLAAMPWRGIPASPCHGDLTLENILISPTRGVVFIDCDEPFASSFWLDAGKLYQDFHGYWFLRHLLARPQSGADVLNAVQKLAQLERALHDVFAAADPALPERLPQLAALSLFRILPYARDEATVNFVLTRLSHILDL